MGKNNTHFGVKRSILVVDRASIVDQDLIRHFENEEQWANCMIDAYQRMSSQELEEKYNIAYRVVIKIVTRVYNNGI